MKLELLHGDSVKLAGELEYTAVITDPPYGMGWHADATRFSGGRTKRNNSKKVHKPITGDDKPFDPTRWIDRDKVILFGSNHYAEKLPTGTTLVWLKRSRKALGTFLSDAEIGWMKSGCSVYCHEDLSMTGAGANFPSLHPNQKPVSLMQWCLKKAKVTQDDIVLDPYMGSGTTGIACLTLGIPFIGIEIDKNHYQTAADRIDDFQRQGTLDLEQSGNHP